MEIPIAILILLSINAVLSSGLLPLLLLGAVVLLIMKKYHIALPLKYLKKNTNSDSDICKNNNSQKI